MKSTTISCIILAGGEGRRFDNKDKGLIAYHGKTLIAHIIEHIRPQVDDIVISANRNLDSYAQYTKKVIRDRSSEFPGPLTGIVSCLDECNHEWILVLPCDIPFLPDDLVAQLSVGKERLRIATAHGRRQLVFLMHASLKQNLNTYLKQGQQRVMTWIDLQKPTVVEFNNNSNDFLNINTSADLMQLH